MFPPRGQSQTHARAEEAEQCFLGGEEETHRPTGMERLADSDNDDGRWAWPLSMRVFLSFLRRQRQTAEPRTKDKREAEEGGTGGGFQASPAAKPPTPVFPCVFPLCPSPPPPQNHHRPPKPPLAPPLFCCGQRRARAAHVASRPPILCVVFLGRSPDWSKPPKHTPPAWSAREIALTAFLPKPKKAKTLPETPLYSF